ncbi:MAG: polysaccharide biosynthesis tyrosine autokinase [Nocardioidaceae bacterium]
MELDDYLKVLRRRWKWIVASVLACLVVAVVYTLAQTPLYRSSAKLYITTDAAQSASEVIEGTTYGERKVASYVDLVTSRELASRVSDDLGLDGSPSEAGATVSATAVADTSNMIVSVTDPDPHEAQRIAQSYAENLTDLVRELETTAGVTTPTIKATIIDSASLPDSAFSPSLARNVGLGIVLGLVAGLGLALLRHALDTRVHSAEDLEAISDAPVLGAIVFDSQTTKTPLVSDIPSHSPRAEAFRVLRTNLQFVDVDNDHKLFVLSSAVPEEGKTTTSINLGISLAQAGVRTLLVECDLRRPRAAVRLELDGAIGVTNTLVGRVKLDDALQTHPASGLDFLAAGPIPPNPAELLQSNAMSEMMAELRQRYDVVIMDAPPLLPVTDAALLSAKADGTILVVRHGKATREQVRHSIERLVQVDSRLVGLVLNMVPGKGRGSGYGGYGYGYGYAPEAGRHRD